jgi:hypothetical protein
MRSPCCLCVCVSPSINLWMPESIFIKSGAYIVASESVSKAYFINPYHQSVCLYVYHLFVARQRLVKYVPAAKNICNKRIFGRNIFFVVRVLSKKSLWVCPCIPIELLGNNSVKTFPRQRRILGGLVFYAVGVVLKESRRLVRPRTPCLVSQWMDWRRNSDLVSYSGGTRVEPRPGRRLSSLRSSLLFLSHSSQMLGEYPEKAKPAHVQQLSNSSFIHNPTIQRYIIF